MVTLSQLLVILVHGLFGHPRKTWTAKNLRPKKAGMKNVWTHTEKRSTNHSSLGDGVFWPQKLLPNTIPDAKIFSFGYNADVGGFLSPTSQNSISQHAEALLSDLADLRDKPAEQEIPLIFVVHSLGGIIVKEAIILSDSTVGTRLKTIAPATFAICFLGTPHRGSSIASLGKTAWKVTVIATNRPNLKLLQGLKRNSETLTRVSRGFSQILLKHKIAIYSFREEQETRKFLVFNTMVVDAESAMIGNGEEEVQGIPADHSNMTKFASASDIGFKRVSAQIRRWIEELRAAPLMENHNDCLDSLSDPATKARIGEVHKAHEKTFHWLFDPAIVSFADWLRYSQLGKHPIYWIQGKPGSGKSTLMRFAMCDPRLLELLSSQSVENSEIHAAGTPRISSDTHSVQGEANYQAWTVAAFFFHDRGSEMQKTLVGMLQEILRSILCQVPALITYVMPAFNNLFQTKRKTKPQWDLENLQSALVCIFKQRQVRVRILFLLDALDEHSGDKERLALLLENLVEIADNDFVGLKMCLASRSWNVFEEHFGNCPGFAIHEHTKLDISTYVTSRLRPSTQTFESLAEERSLNALIELLTDKALGVFIWVRLVVDQLVKGIRDGTPFAALEIRARDMPQELKDLYADTLRRIEPEYTTEAYIMLQTALCTSAPLPVKSFMGSVGFNYDYMNQSRRLQVDGPGKRKIEESLPTQLRRLASRSGGLLEVVSIPTLDGAEGNEPDRVVQFIHQTVKEYVQLLQHHAVLREVHPNVLEENGHIFLLRTCVESNESWVCCIKKSLFAHAKHIDDIEADIEKAGVSNTRIPIVAPLLHQIFDSKGDFGMAWWLEERQEPFYEVLKLELEDNRSGAYKNRTTLYRLAVAANLLNFIQNANPQQINKLDLLHIAAAGPDINTSSSKVDICEMVRIVLGRGQLVSQKSLWFEKMFIGALISTQGEPLGCLLVADQVFSGRDEVTRLSIARILLKSGADANGSIYSKTTDDHKVIVMSSLEYCVLFRSASFVRLLLDCGAMFNPERLLGFAYIRQDHDVIRILHQFGLESQIHHSRSLPHVVDAMVPSGEMLAVSSGGVLTALSSIFRKVEADVETNAGSTLIPDWNGIIELAARVNPPRT